MKVRVKSRVNNLFATLSMNNFINSTKLRLLSFFKNDFEKFLNHKKDKHYYQEIF